MDYKEYIQSTIFPIYEKNDKGHNIEHINSVIEKVIEYNKKYNLDEKILYIAAAFHDIAHHIDKDNHEILSAKYFKEDEFMKKYLTKEESDIIFQTIEDHRASKGKCPRSMYGKLLLSADKTMTFEVFITRTYHYSVKHFPNYTKEDRMRSIYEHMIEKYSNDGYAKSYIEYDMDLLNFRKKVELYKKNYNLYKEAYLRIISII